MKPPSENTMQYRSIGALFAAAFLASCGGSSGVAKGPPQLHLACQTIECECREIESELLEKRKITDIVWRLNGDATCPVGFVLEKVEVDFLGRRR
jgi:hypothetical protein